MTDPRLLASDARRTANRLLVGWARMSCTPVPTIAQTLLRGICEGSPQTEARQRPLMRWLEVQLRDGDPGHSQLGTHPGDQPVANRPMSLRARAECGTGVCRGATHADPRPCTTTSHPPRGARPRRVYDPSR